MSEHEVDKMLTMEIDRDKRNFIFQEMNDIADKFEEAGIEQHNCCRIRAIARELNDMCNCMIMDQNLARRLFDEKVALGIKNAEKAKQIKRLKERITKLNRTSKIERGKAVVKTDFATLFDAINSIAGIITERLPPPEET